MHAERWQTSTFEAKSARAKLSSSVFNLKILATWVTLSILPSPAVRASPDEDYSPTIKKSVAERQSEESSTNGIAATQQAPAACHLSMSLTALTAGFIGTQLHCPGTFFWSAEPGLLLYGFDRPDAYLESSIGIDYPTEEASRSATSESSWRVRTTVAYVYVRPNSFEYLQQAQPSNGLRSPGLQQWAILANSKVSSEFLLRLGPSHQLFNLVGIQLWQTLPPLWRGLGGLRQTRKGQMSGFSLSGYGSHGAWHASVGLGLSSIALERTVFTFAHPTFELKYGLGSF